MGGSDLASWEFPPTSTPNSELPTPTLNPQLLTPTPCLLNFLTHDFQPNLLLLLPIPTPNNSHLSPAFHPSLNITLP